jgi:UDP-N-acetylmuramate dehydrogenase
LIQVQHHVSLKEWNTFGVSAFAKAYILITTRQQLKEALGYCYKEPIFLLGGGSNMLIVKDIERTVLHLQLKGISKKSLENGKVLITAQAGENWHEFVKYCIKNNFAGLENLSLIPGNVGTAPIQNIGAYGVEIKDVFHSCEVMDIATQELETFTAAECRFGYRDSIFKNKARGRYIITSVTFELQDLSINPDYQFRTSYGAIQDELKNLGGEISLQKVSQAVINIRNSKLPNPKEIGNSGSFFKNPVIARERYEDLVRMHSGMPSYPVDQNHVKVPAGWLIEHSEMKGKRWGDAGVHDRQALVLVNHGNATGEEIIAVAKKVQEAVKARFGIEIEIEVNIVD